MKKLARKALYEPSDFQIASSRIFIDACARCAG
jgi:hypothetical protein